MNGVCIDRLYLAFKGLEDQQITCAWANESRTIIEILDGLNGTGRFIVLAEKVNESDVHLLTKLFSRLDGNLPDVLRAYEYMLAFNGSGFGVHLGLDPDTRYFGAMVSFRCQPDIELLQEDALYYLSNLTTFMERFYDDIIRELYQMGVKPVA